MAILQSDHLLSFLDIAKIKNGELTTEIMDIFEQFHNRVGSRVQNVIVIFSSSVELYQVFLFLYKTNLKNQLQQSITETPLALYHAFFDSNVATLLPFLQTLRLCQKWYNEQHANQFVGLTVLDIMPDMDVSGNHSQVHPNMALMSMSMQTWFIRQ